MSGGAEATGLVFTIAGINTGLLHALLSISDERDLATHNKLGSSWEGFALESVARKLGRRNEELFFWATHAGAEVDLAWQASGCWWAVEVKYQSAPKLTASMKSAINDLDLAHLWVVYPGETAYPLSTRASALPLSLLNTMATRPV